MPYNAGEAPALGAAALPATATICSCHNVTKGDIVEAMDAGFYSLGDIKSETKASTGCGGCAALLKNIVDDETGELVGWRWTSSICEHFAYTRQELFHLIKVGNIRDLR